MQTLTIPFQAPFSKVLKRREISRSRDAVGQPSQSTTSYLMLSTLSGTINLTNAEYNTILDVYENSGNEPFLCKDPTDFSATSDRLYDGYGGWTQGLYIPSYYLPCGCFVKAYGVSSELGKEWDSIYLRPIAHVTTAEVFVYFEEGRSVSLIEHNPDTQLVKLELPDVGVNQDYQKPEFYAYSTRDLDSPNYVNITQTMCFPADFEFENAYKITRFDENNATRSRRLLGQSNKDRTVDIMLEEVFINTLSYYHSWELKDVLD